MDPENKLSQKKIIIFSFPMLGLDLQKVKRTVSIKRTVYKKVLTSVLKVLYNPKIGTIIS